MRLRPEFYSKELALRSCLEALVNCGIDSSITFLADGSARSPVVSLMEVSGDVLTLDPPQGNAGSYRAAIGHILVANWAPNDLVYLAEDDYLYQPRAMRALVEATEVCKADYMTLYDHPDYYRMVRHKRFMRKRAGMSVCTTSGIRWRPVLSTCMTFAGRLASFRRDAWLHLLAKRAEEPDDFAMWSVLSGGPTARLAQIFTHSAGIGDRSALRALWRSRVRPRSMRELILIAPACPLATHMQTGEMAPGCDWGAVAASVQWDR